MASVKAEKAVGTQLFGQAKKDPAPKPGDNATAKAPASKSGAKKAAPKPQEPKKKVYIYIHILLAHAFISHAAMPFLTACYLKLACMHAIVGDEL